MRLRHIDILHLVPVFVLLGILGLNQLLVHKHGLSVWRVGSFGMFSSLDNRSTRFIQAVSVSEEGSTILDLSSYEDTVEYLRIFPHEDRLRQFLKQIGCDHELLSRSAESVELTYYGIDVDEKVVTPVVRWRERENVC